MSDLQTIPARRGVAQRVSAGQAVEVINTHGAQVVDTWAFRADDPREFMSMEHCRPTMGKIIPEVGDDLVTNRRAAILTLEADTTPGVHDTLIAACDQYRYEMLGAEGYHDNCTDNLVAALKALEITAPEVPAPLNLFMNIPVTQGRYVNFDAPVSEKGQSVTLRARMDAVVVFSACPQDMAPVNGEFMTPTEAHYRLV